MAQQRCKSCGIIFVPLAKPSLGHFGIRAERGVDRQSLLTHDEQGALMTLWVMNRSPLMIGGDLPTSDDFTISLLTNDEVLDILRASCANRELLRSGSHIVWAARSTEADDQYLALFNIGDTATDPVQIDLSLLGSGVSYALRDLWQKVDLGRAGHISRVDCASCREIVPAAARQLTRRQHHAARSDRSRNVRANVGIPTTLSRAGLGISTSSSAFSFIGASIQFPRFRTNGIPAISISKAARNLSNPFIPFIFSTFGSFHSGQPPYKEAIRL
jgi:hypothetical protein